MRFLKNYFFGIVGLAFLTLALATNSYFIVSPTQVAGTRWMGGGVMEANPIGVGFHFKVPFLEDVDYLQVSQSVYSLNNMQVYTNDNQLVQLSVNVIYRIPTSDAFHLLYGVGRAGSFDISETVLPVIRDQALATFAQYNTLTISDRRTEIAAAMQKSVTEALYHVFGIQVIGLQITGITYSPVFTRAVEAAVTAKAEAVSAENSVLRRKYEGEQQVVTAKAGAEAQIASANGTAQSTIIKADARAKAIAIVGQALNANADYLKFQQNDRWDGALPRYVGGGGSALPVIDMSNDNKTH